MKTVLVLVLDTTTELSVTSEAGLLLVKERVVDTGTADKREADNVVMKYADIITRSDTEQQTSSIYFNCI